MLLYPSQLIHQHNLFTLAIASLQDICTGLFKGLNAGLPTAAITEINHQICLFAYGINCFLQGITFFVLELYHFETDLLT